MIKKKNIKKWGVTISFKYDRNIKTNMLDINIKPSTSHRLKSIENKLERIQRIVKNFNEEAGKEGLFPIKSEELSDECKFWSDQPEVLCQNPDVAISFMPRHETGELLLCYPKSFGSYACFNEEGEFFDVAGSGKIWKPSYRRKSNKMPNLPIDLIIQQERSGISDFIPYMDVVDSGLSKILSEIEDVIFLDSTEKAKRSREQNIELGLSMFYDTKGSPSQNIWDISKEGCKRAASRFKKMGMDALSATLTLGDVQNSLERDGYSVNQDEMKNCISIFVKELD